MHITSLYGALLGLLFVGLSVRTVQLRHKLGVAVGDGDNPQLLRAMRVHANFAEYVPLCLLLVAFCEVQGASAIYLHSVLASLLLARLAHAYGVSRVHEPYRFRIFGVAITLAVLVTSCVRLMVFFARASGA